MQIYLSRDGNQYGPYSVDELRQFFQQGYFSETDYACFDGQNWVTVADVPGIVSPGDVQGAEAQAPEQAQGVEPAQAQSAQEPRPEEAVDRSSETQGQDASSQQSKAPGQSQPVRGIGKKKPIRKVSLAKRQASTRPRAANQKKRPARRRPAPSGKRLANLKSRFLSASRALKGRLQPLLARLQPVLTRLEPFLEKQKAAFRESKAYRWRMIVAGSVLAVLLVWLFWGESYDPGADLVANLSRAKIVEMSGQVTFVARQEGQDKVVKRQGGQFLKAGETLKTGDNGKITLLFSNGGLVSAQPKTAFLLKRYHQEEYLTTGKKLSELEEEPGVSTTELDLDFGELIIQTKKLKRGEGSVFEINTKFGQAGIRGTEFRVARLGSQVILDVTEGLVEFEAEDGDDAEIAEGITQVIEQKTGESTQALAPQQISEEVKQRVKQVTTSAQEKVKDLTDRAFVPRIVEIWRNASTGLDRDKLDDLLKTRPPQTKHITDFEFPQELHGRAAYKDSLFVIRGHFLPPVTGTYTMTLSKRVQGRWGQTGLVGKAQLWFQPDPSDSDSFQMVASLKKDVGGINTPANEKGFELEADERYYFEYVHEYGHWQRRTGMAGGFRLHGGETVLRMESKHFIPTYLE